MPKKGNGKKVGLVPRILHGIRDDSRLLLEDMNRGFATVNSRLDGIIEIAGGHRRDHEECLKTLEQRVDRLER